MKGNRFLKSVLFWAAVAAALAALCGPASAAVTPDPPYEAAAAPAPAPAPFTWNWACARYGNYILYPGADKKIYAVDTVTGGTRLACDTSAIAADFAVAGFLVTSDGKLYFHDNQFVATGLIFRADLTGAWPVAYQELATGCPGSIFAFTQNPWDGSVWFCAAEFMGNMYLYEVADDFSAATQVGAGFAPPHGGGSGPIAFSAPGAILYGEYDWNNGIGYFHQVDAATGAIVAADYVALPGGLAAATLGYENAVYAASGAGKTIYKITDGAAVAVAQTTDDAQWIGFGSSNLVVAELSAAGQTSFSTLSRPAYAKLADPAPGMFEQSYALSWYKDQLLYAAKDGKIYAMNTDTGNTLPVSDTSALIGGASVVSAFCLVRGDHLYFSDNGVNPDKIYAVDLTAAWPAAYTETATGCDGVIADIAQNPFTGTLWFSTFDIVGNRIRLYEITTGGAVVKRTEFAPRHGGAAGPVAFQDANAALVGEQVNNGNGYFHKVNTDTGDVLYFDFFAFTGGLIDAKNAYDNTIYVTTGWGKALYSLDNNAAALKLTTTGSLWGMSFNGDSVFTAELNAATQQMELFEYNNPPAAPAYTALSAPSPAFYTWNPSIGYANNCMFYAAADGKVYARNKDTNAVTLVADTSQYATAWSAVSGFLGGNDGYVFFHENTFPTTRIFRVNLNGTLPATGAAIQVLNTGCQGSIYALAVNPWDGFLYAASGDLGAGRFYLYRISADFGAAIPVADFAAPHFGGNGPIIFAGPNLCLYGESVWAGDGYFHMLNTDTGALVVDYYLFEGGLAGACYGRLFAIHATSGDGKTLYQLAGGQKRAVMLFPLSAQSVVFDGLRFFVSLMDAAGQTSLVRLGPGATPMPTPGGTGNSGDSSSGCFIDSMKSAGHGPGFGPALAVLALAGAFCLAAVIRRR